MRLSKIFERPIRRHRLDFANPIQKLNPKKVLDLILEQCYMALTPCLVVGGKPLDVESNGFFFLFHHLGECAFQDVLNFRHLLLSEPFHDGLIRIHWEGVGIRRQSIRT